MSFILSCKQWAKLLYYRKKIGNKVNAHNIANYYIISWTWKMVGIIYTYFNTYLIRWSVMQIVCVKYVLSIFYSHTAKVLVLVLTSGNDS